MRQPEIVEIRMSLSSILTELTFVKSTLNDNRTQTINWEVNTLTRLVRELDDAIEALVSSEAYTSALRPREYA